MDKVKKIAYSQAARFVVCMLLVWAALAYITDARDLVVIENAVTTSLAVAILVAYSRVAADAFCSPTMNRAHLLALGIFLAWAGTAVVRFIGVLHYGFKLPVLGTDFTTFGVYLQLLAACLHLAAPVVDPGGIWPMRERIKTGLWAGGGVLVLMIFLLVKGAM